MIRLLRVSALSLLLALIPGMTRHASAAPPSNAIKHVIVITFDNVHLSDIYQMPHLTAFLRQGSLFDNNHTVLDSHTQPDLTSFISGAYPDKTGIPNQSFFDRGNFVTWSYWENQAYAHTNRGATDINYGHNYVGVPNPWKPYNDRGWDVGTVSGADMALENTSEVRQYGVMNGTDKNAADYLGYAIHCAAGSSNCAGASSKTPPNTIFGSPNIPWLLSAPLLDGSGTVGPFCNYVDFCVSAMSSLSATYAMQAHGIPVTYSYIDDAHHQFDPGTTSYQQVLQQYDHAFDLFFTKLAGIGITRDNALFVLTADEGDQFVAGGERNTGLLGWLKTGTYNYLPSNFNIISDSAPLIYMNNSADVPYALESLQNIPNWQYVAHGDALSAIHNSTASDPNLASRQPSFILFGSPDTWWNGFGNAAYDRNFVAGPDFKWDHGTISPDINTTWLGMVGPNIRAQQTGTFIDHVDAAPTIDWLLGYPIPSYMDGRVLYEVLDPSLLPPSITPQIGQLADMYKQINAPLGTFSLEALQISTRIASHASSPLAATEEAHLASLVAQRNALAAQMQALINGAATGTPVDPALATSLVMQANGLLFAAY